MCINIKKREKPVQSLTGLYTLRARWALGPARSLTLPRFLACAPAYRRANDVTEKQKTQHQPRAHAYPSLSLRVGTSYTAGTLGEIKIMNF
jgi:hypothetical protein